MGKDTVMRCLVCGREGHVWCTESPKPEPAFEPGSPEDRLLRAIFGERVEE